MADLTVDQWDELVTEVRTEVERAAKDADSPILGTVLDVLEDPNDFVDEVVERLKA